MPIGGNEIVHPLQGCGEVRVSGLRRCADSREQYHHKYSEKLFHHRLLHAVHGADSTIVAILRPADLCLFVTSPVRQWTVVESARIAEDLCRRNVIGVEERTLTKPSVVLAALRLL
jgi:hypothetical protein